MHSYLMLWLALPARMAAAAVFVVVAARAAETAGPMIGAMVATLPLSAGPTYLFVSLDHDSRFIAASALGSLAANAANILFCTVHAAIARSRGLAASLLTALAGWVLLMIAVRTVDWTLPDAILLNVLFLALCLPLGRKFGGAAMPPVRRRRTDIPIRAAMVAVLVATVTGLSSYVGPTVTGILALFPIVLTSLVLIFQPRIGGPATAAVTANAILGLAGFATALTVLHLTAVPLGSAAALTLALSVSISWNFSVAMIRRRRALIRLAVAGRDRDAS